MRRLLLLLIAVFFFNIFGFSQSRILLTIGDKEITKDEFIRIYQKNNSPNIAIDIKTVEEYLELFINFKLKVIKAEDLGYDTVSTYLDELEKYTTQLAQPYFIDKTVEEQLYREAYKRLQEEIRISYIFVKIPQNPTIQDTLFAYNKIIEARKRILNGEEFSAVAMQVSDAQTAKTDGGDAWYLSAFKAPYIIENFIYNNPIGALSLPLRIPTGYFMVKVTDKRPANPEINAAHIMVALPQGASKEDSLNAIMKLDTIQQLLKSGMSFDEIAKKYSDDYGSAPKGGELGWFGVGRMVRPFEEAAFALKNIGDISAPIKTIFGWHIIKLLDKKPLQSYEEIKADIENKVKRDDRYNLVTEAVTNAFKVKNNFKLENGLKNFYTKVDSTIFTKSWQIGNFANSNTVLFSFADKKYTEKDFAQYLYTTQTNGRAIPIYLYIDQKFQEFIKEKIKEYQIANLPNEHPEYKYIVQEYHDGLLLFDITEDLVWSKAVEDTVGLTKFFNENKLNYYEKLNLSIFSYTEEKYLNKAKRYLNKKIQKQYTDSVIVAKVDKSFQNFNIDTVGVFARGNNEIADRIFKMYENKEIAPNQVYVVFDDIKKIVYLNSNFRYVKGLVTADYQNYLEQIWINKLKEEYNVVINQEVLEEIKAEIGN